MYCVICGDEDKLKVHSFWDRDDGQRIGALCPYCWEECKDDTPHESDYAYEKRDNFPKTDGLDVEDVEDFILSTY